MYDEEEDTKPSFCMDNVPFTLKTSDYDTVKLYRIIDYGQKILSFMSLTCNRITSSSFQLS